MLHCILSVATATTQIELLAEGANGEGFQQGSEEEEEEKEMVEYA